MKCTTLNKTCRQQVRWKWWTCYFLRKAETLKEAQEKVYAEKSKNIHGTNSSTEKILVGERFIVP